MDFHLNSSHSTCRNHLGNLSTSGGENETLDKEFDSLSLPTD